MALTFHVIISNRIAAFPTSLQGHLKAQEGLQFLFLLTIIDGCLHISGKQTSQNAVTRLVRMHVKTHSTYTYNHVHHWILAGSTLDAQRMMFDSLSMIFLPQSIVFSSCVANHV